MIEVTTEAEVQLALHHLLEIDQLVLSAAVAGHLIQSSTDAGAVVKKATLVRTVPSSPISRSAMVERSQRDTKERMRSRSRREVNLPRSLLQSRSSLWRLVLNPVSIRRLQLLYGLC